MGYKPGKRIYNLGFENYPGLEIRAVATSLGKLIEISNMRVNLHGADEQERMKVFDLFAQCILSWNIEHPAIGPDSMIETPCPICGLIEGVPLPATAKGMLCLDLDFLMQIIFGWMAAVSRVAGPKEMSLSAGGMNTEMLMKQLAEEQSPLRSPTPNLF